MRAYSAHWAAKLRVRGRCVQIEQGGEWETLRRFPTAAAARRGLARRQWDPGIACNDLVRALAKALRERGRP